jgi:hypothetical protein
VSKDSSPQAFFPGYVVPALLGVLILINLLTGRAYWPRRHGSIAVYTDGWRFGGTILLEAGIAAGLFAWYVLANDERRDHLNQPALGLAVFSCNRRSRAFLIRIPHLRSGPSNARPRSAAGPVRRSGF